MRSTFLTKTLISSLLLIFGFVFGLRAQADQTEDRARMLLNLMDYIAKDYAMAVRGGVVQSDFEYAEMQEFAANARSYAELLVNSGAVDTTIKIEIQELTSLISEKANENTVAGQADEVKRILIAHNLIALSPLQWPDRQQGGVLFQQQCASCHGVNGQGDGPAGAALTPAPTNFLDASIMSGVAPLQAFNTIKLGIPGTGMRAFGELTEEEIWNLSFYIVSLRHVGAEKSGGETSGISLDEISRLSDEELEDQYPAIDLASVRLQIPTTETEPEAFSTSIDHALALLSQAQAAYENGDLESARSLALRAYLEGVEPVEPQIMASDNALFVEVESAMMNVRMRMTDGASAVEVAEAIKGAEVYLHEAADLIATEERGLWMTAVAALTILLREGLEAFFVILAILSVLRSLGAKHATRWIHGGWMSAVLVGVVGWFFADSLLQWNAQSRELMEAIIALAAVLILLYLGFWLHGKTNAAKWKEFVETRVKRLLNANNMFGLGAFAFIVVFREAFESVLFLSSLTADGSSDSRMGVFTGAVLAAVLLILMALLMLRWFKKLPIRSVFLYSSMLILALAFVLAGQGVHALQEGGFLAVHSAPVNLRISVLGIYPTWETMGLQLAVLAGIGVLWKLNTRPSTK